MNALKTTNNSTAHKEILLVSLWTVHAQRHQTKTCSKHVLIYDKYRVMQRRNYHLRHAVLYSICARVKNCICIQASNNTHVHVCTHSLNKRNYSSMRRVHECNYINLNLLVIKYFKYQCSMWMNNKNIMEESDIPNNSHTC